MTPSLSQLATTLAETHPAPSDQAPEQKEVRDLVNRDLREHDMYWGGFRINHMVHKLYCQWVLGANTERLRALYKSSDFLEPARTSSGEITKDNWDQYLGQRSQVPAYLGFFDDQVTQLGFDPSIRSWVPKLFNRWLGSLCHPLIHLGYAIEFRDRTALVEAFTMASTAQITSSSSTKAPELTGFQPTTSPEEVLKAAVKDPLLKVPRGQGAFRARLTELGSSPVQDRIRQWADQWNVLVSDDILPTQLRQLAILVSGIYVSPRSPEDRPDFFLAHTVTSLFAAHIILPLLEHSQRKSLLHDLFETTLLVYVVQGQVPILLPSEEGGHSGFYLPEAYQNLDEAALHEKIRQLTVDNNDDHVCKVVRAMFYFEKVYGKTQGLFLQAALKTVDQVSGSGEWAF
ncbi:hypothetical protein IWQ61_006239 [Dispira simplex]|nr:hypothetical protein IWQ61_006239 [Dispira simplex]